MANYGYGYLDHETSIKEIFLYADLCNVERFGGVLRVRLIDEYLIVKHPTEDICYFECWLEHPKEIACRHGNHSDISWHLDNYFMAFIVNELGGKIGDDGHDEIIEPDYCTRYPKFKNWFDALHPNRSVLSKLVRKMIRPSLYKLEQQDAGPELWEVI